MVTIKRADPTPARSAPAARPAAGAAKPGGFTYQYRPRTPDQIRQHMNRNLSGREGVWKSDVKIYTAKQGQNKLRILPPPMGGDWPHYGLTVFVHYDIGVNNSAFLCPAKMAGDACPVCEEYKEARSRGAPDEETKAYRERANVGIYVIDRDAEEEGPQVWVISPKRDSSILTLTQDPGTGETLPVDSPDDGYDFYFTRTGQGLKTEYKGEKFATRSSPLSDNKAKRTSWLQYVTDNPLDKMLIHRDYDYIKNVLDGGMPEAQPDAAEGTAPAPKEEAAPPARIARRGAVAAKPAEPEPPAEEPAAEEGEAPPSWDEIMAMDIDTAGQLADHYGLDTSEVDKAGGFESEEQFKEWVAQQLGVEAPAPEPAPVAAKAGTGGWRDKFKAMGGKG